MEEVNVIEKVFQILVLLNYVKLLKTFWGAVICMGQEIKFNLELVTSWRENKEKKSK